VNTDASSVAPLSHVVREWLIADTPASIELWRTPPFWKHQHIQAVEPCSSREQHIARGYTFSASCIYIQQSYHTYTMFSRAETQGGERAHGPGRRVKNSRTTPPPFKTPQTLSGWKRERRPGGKKGKTPGPGFLSPRRGRNLPPCIITPELSIEHTPPLFLKKSPPCVWRDPPPPPPPPGDMTNRERMAKIPHCRRQRNPPGWAGS
jgi:hypothetical protein